MYRMDDRANERLAGGGKTGTGEVEPHDASVFATHPTHNRYFPKVALFDPVFSRISLICSYRPSASIIFGIKARESTIKIGDNSNRHEHLEEDQEGSSSYERFEESSSSVKAESARLER